LVARHRGGGPGPWAKNLVVQKKWKTEKPFNGPGKKQKAQQGDPQTVSVSKTGRNEKKNLFGPWEKVWRGSRNKRKRSGGGGGGGRTVVRSTGELKEGMRSALWPFRGGKEG